MIQIILLIILFLMGIYFGSFFTLATYRLPKKENITYKQSYCPKCNHKLKALDLVPFFSYIFLKGKCRYCNNNIGIRYFLFEILTGIVFVLFGLSLKIDIYSISINQIIYPLLGILYISSLFIIAGIDKEKNTIKNSVLYFGVLVSILYIIYAYTLENTDVHSYVICLVLMIILILIDTIVLKKKLLNNYMNQILILILYMSTFSGFNIGVITILLSILTMGIENIIKYINNKKRALVNTKTNKKPIAFFLCCSNIIAIIFTNFIMNYIIM